MLLVRNLTTTGAVPGMCVMLACVQDSIVNSLIHSVWFGTPVMVITIGAGFLRDLVLVRVGRVNEISSPLSVINSKLRACKSDALLAVTRASNDVSFFVSAKLCLHPMCPNTVESAV